MFTLRIKNDKGDIYELTHNYSRYYVTSIEGLTPQSVTINTLVAGMADGVFYNSSRLQSRNIVITVVLEGDIETNRQQLYSIFPLKKEIEIHYINKNRNMKIRGYVESIEGSIFTQQEKMQISVICPRPYFEGASKIHSEISRAVPLFEFPFSLDEPVPVSEFRRNPVSYIENVGDVECGCIITVNIKNTITGFRITNLSRREVFSVSNFSFIKGDTVAISTIRGNLGAFVSRSFASRNLMPYVDDNSKWFELSPGNNAFTYTSSSGNIDDLSIEMDFIPLYGGA